MKSNLLKVSLRQIFPRVFNPEEEQRLKVKFQAILPPIYRVRVSLSVMTIERLFGHVFSAQSRHFLTLVKPFVNDYTVTDNTTLSPTKAIKLATQLTDLQFKEFTKSLSDRPRAIDRPFKGISKPLINSFVADEALSLNSLLSKADTFNVESNLTLQAIKFFDSEGALVDELNRIVSFNRKFNHESIAETKIKFNLNKSLENFAYIDENFTRVVDFNIPENDFLDLNDEFTRVVDFDRKFNDATNTTTDTKISSVLSKNSVSDLIDNQIFSVGKVLGDEVNSIDLFLRVVSYLRSFSDETNILDDSTLDLIKSFNDSSEFLSDSTLNTIKSLQDSPEAADVFSRIVDYERVFNHISDILDSLSLDTNKPFSNDFTIDSESLLNITKSLTSFVENVSNDPVFNFTKILRDSAITFEDTNLTDGSLFDFIKIIGFSALISEEISILVDYVREFDDVVNSTDFSLLNTTKGLNSQSNTVDDIIFVLSKKLFSTSNAVSQANILFNKVIEFSALISEEISILVDYVREFDDVVNSTDFSLLNTTKGLNSQSETLDNIVFALSTKLFLVSNAVSQINILFTKILTNTVNVDHFIRIDATKKILDNTEILSSLKFDVNSTIINNTEIQDSGRGFFQSYAGPDYFIHEEEYVGEEILF
jgi:hypothetical protein